MSARNRWPPAPPPGAPEGVVLVSEADPDGFLQDISAGPRHHLLADEPKDFGGTDRGLSPYGLLAAALGACTSMTIRMYARRKGWPLAHVSVEVTHDKGGGLKGNAGGPAPAPPGYSWTNDDRGVRKRADQSGQISGMRALAMMPIERLSGMPTRRKSANL